MSNAKRYTVIGLCLALIAGAVALLFFKEHFTKEYIREVQLAFMGACVLVVVLGSAIIGLSDGEPKKAPLATRVAKSLPMWKAIGTSLGRFAWTRIEDGLVYAAAKAGQVYHAHRHPRLR